MVLFPAVLVRPKQAAGKRSVCPKVRFFLPILWYCPGARGANPARAERNRGRAAAYCVRKTPPMRAGPNAPPHRQAVPLTATPLSPSRSAAIPPGPPYHPPPSIRRRAAIEAHDCKSPFAEAGRTEIMLLASVLAVVERLAWVLPRASVVVKKVGLR